MTICKICMAAEDDRPGNTAFDYYRLMINGQETYGHVCSTCAVSLEDCGAELDMIEQYDTNK